MLLLQFIIGKKTMPQLNEEHFEVTDKDKDKEDRSQRQKLISLEDKIKVLEKSVERLNKLIGDVMEVKK